MAMVKMSARGVQRIFHQFFSIPGHYWAQRLLCTSSLPGSFHQARRSQYDVVRSILMTDSSRTVAKLKSGVCDNPKEANTNLLNFLNQSDITKRKVNSRIPFFTAGSYLLVTRADPFSPRGESKFVGICIARRKVNTLGSTFTMRNVIDGIGVEIMFELYSPAIKEIKVLKLEKRRRAKLYYLRDKPPKYSTVKENMKPVPNAGKIAVYRRKPGEPA
ncbi:large ribosomal subunit protein bL19m-like [Halichondria panicea]|uniref:large ribosomal subunit protein bL19m-like n=1 Tax=Halichondria panicea TaxID=6063 RepID=UPI00312B3287